MTEQDKQTIADTLNMLNEICNFLFLRVQALEEAVATLQGNKK